MLASALSVAKLPYDQAQDGISLTATVVPSGLGRFKDEQVINLVGLLDAYIVSQGFHINVNVFEPETLEDAMQASGELPAAHHPGLRVRRQLRPADPEQQLDVLSRTFHGRRGSAAHDHHDDVAGMPSLVRPSPLGYERDGQLPARGIRAINQDALMRSQASLSTSGSPKPWIWCR